MFVKYVLSVSCVPGQPGSGGLCGDEGDASRHSGRGEGGLSKFPCIMNAYVKFKLLPSKVLEKVMDKITEARRVGGGPAAA